MSELLENIGIIFSNILTWLGQMASSLITNPIFIVLMAVTIFTLLISLLINLIKTKKDYKNWKENYSQNAIDMEEEEQNYIEDYGRW